MEEFESHDGFTVDVHGAFDVIPVCMEDGSVGYDIALPEEEGDLVLPPGTRRTINTGIIVSPPVWCFEMIVPRSSAYDQNIRITNTVGVIDPSYSGRDDMIKVCLERTRSPEYAFVETIPMEEGSPAKALENHDDFTTEVLTSHSGYRWEVHDGMLHLFESIRVDPVPYEAGERFCQMLFLPFGKPELIEKHLDAFDKDSRGGFGSTDDA